MTLGIGEKRRSRPLDVISVCLAGYVGVPCERDLHQVTVLGDQIAVIVAGHRRGRPKTSRPS
jgi:hypothetical protein